MNWMVPKNKLDGEQKAILNEILYSDENYFVRGCPGTGKSVLLAHLYLEYKSAHPNARVCILTYTHALIACIKDGLPEMTLPIYTFPFFSGRRSREHWDLILVDEAQDMESLWAFKISQCASRVVLFGDFGQSIYGDRVDESGLDEYFQPNKLTLNTIYRLTRSLKTLVEHVYPARVMNAQIGRLVADTDIQLLHGDGQQEEFDCVAGMALKMAAPQRPVGVLFERRRSIVAFLRSVDGSLSQKFDLNDDLNAILRSNGVKFRFLGNGFGDLAESNRQPIVYVMTWHSSKGLDFESVVLPTIDRGNMEDSTFYVAMTRARRNLVMTYRSSCDAKIKRISECSVVKRMEISGLQATAGSAGNEGDILF